MPTKRTLGRPTVEAYGGMGLAIVLGVVPMTWWMKCILLVGMLVLVVDLLIGSEWTKNLSVLHKTFLSIFAAIAITVLGWRPVINQYYEDNLTSTSQAIKKIKEHLDKETTTRVVLAAINTQLDRLMFGTVVWENSIGRPDLPQRLLVENHILSEMRVLLGPINVRAVSHDSGDLWLITGQNSFRITFSTVMRIAPKITFANIPEGVTPNIIEESRIGFWVIFSPQTVNVETFGYSADARL